MAKQYHRGDPRRDWASAQKFISDRRENWTMAAKQLQKDAIFSPPEDFPGERKINTLEDAVETLGVGVGTRRDTARKLIAEVAKDSRQAYAIAKEAGKTFDKYQVREIIRRGLRLNELARKSMGDNSLMKTFVSEADAKAAGDRMKSERAKAMAAGYTSFGSKKGGLRKPGKGGGYDYWYPGQGFGHTPHDEEHGHHHEEHENSIPSDEVSAAWDEVKALAEKNGVKIQVPSHAFPHSKTTMEDMERYKDKINQLAGNSQGTESDEETTEPPSDEPTAENEDGENERDTSGESDDEAGESTEDDDDGDAESAQSEDGEDGDNTEPDDDTEDDPEFDPEKDLGFELDDDGNPIGHDVPESPHEIEQLREQVDDLMSIVADLTNRLDAQQQADAEKLRKQAAQVRANPSPQGVFWLAKALASFLTIGGWALVGGMFGGPAGLILGYAFGHHMNMKKKMMMAATAQRHQQTAGGAVGGKLSRVEKHDHREFMAHLKNRLKENDNADGSDIMTPRERLQLLDHIEYTKWRRKNGIPLDKDEVAKVAKSDVFIDLGTGRLLVKADSTEARQEARAKIRPERQRAQDELDERISKLLAEIKVEKKPAYLPKKQKKGDNRKPVKNTEPLTKAHLRSRKPTNEYGHRDGLTPGQLLPLRRTHIMKGKDASAIVAEDGKFQLGDQIFENGHQLLTELYGKPTHKMTIRRYFKLGARNGD